MRLIDLSPITTTAGMPGKSGVVTHLQGSLIQLINALAISFAGNNFDPAKAYVLNGIINIGTAPSFICNTGFVFFGGEVYEVDAISFVLTAGQVVVGNIVTTFATGPAGDPIQFTDGSMHNVLQIRKVVMSGGTTGSGSLPDFSKWIYCSSPSVMTQIIPAFGTAYTVNFKQDQAIFFTAGPGSGVSNVNFDFNGALPGTVVRLKIVAALGATINVATPAGSNVFNLGGVITPNKTNFATFEFLGVNESGNFEVTYNVISL